MTRGPAPAEAAPPAILVCDDEEHLREMVCEYLCERGFAARPVPDAARLHAEMASAPADLVVLDINMPGEDGLSALRQLRRTSDAPVIMLTATADTIDRVIGLEIGADDYLGKPVELRELEARIRAVLRRRPGAGGEGDAKAVSAQGEVVPFGPCRLDLGRARLFGADGAEIAITAMEFHLLKVFARNKGRVLNRDQLLEQAHDRAWEPFDRSIDLRVSRLRRKIEPNPTKPEIIRTVRGIGYVFG
ncbi:MAG: response regulator [Pseudomonadota bacterium]